MNRYVEEVEDFYLKLKKSSVILSPKERDIILSWYRKNVPVSIIKNLIKTEFHRYPVSKKRRFSLLIVDKKVNEYLKREKVKIKDKSIVKTSNNFTDLEQKISKIWKKLPEEEKQKITLEAAKQIRGLNLNNEEKQEALKTVIRKIVKDKYL